MKHFKLILINAGLLILMGACKSDDEAMMAQFGAINGVVLDTEGQTYSNVTVTLDDVGGGLVQTRSSDENGFYEMSQIAVGNFEMDFNPPLGGATTNANPIQVVIGDGTTTVQDLTFEPQPVMASLVLGATDPIDEVRTAQNEVPTNPGDLLYTPLVFQEPLGELHAILAPDGHHITLEEWETAQGTATVSCAGETTKYSLEFTGLIPNGVYTVWNFILTKHLDATNNINFQTDLAGSGALGNGSSNVMIASQTGEVQLEVTMDPGPLSMFGTQPACVISNTPGFILVINYHIDGQTHGNFPGPDKDDVAHLLIYF